MTGTIFRSYVRWPEGIEFDISACHAHTTGKKKSHAYVMPTVLLSTAPLFQKVTPKSCLKGFPAWHRDHCSTRSIDVVSKCSYGHSSCFSWSNVLHSNQHVLAVPSPCSSLPLLPLTPDSFPSPWRQQHSSRRRQQPTSNHCLCIYIYIYMYLSLSIYIYMYVSLSLYICMYFSL